MIVVKFNKDVEQSASESIENYCKDFTMKDISVALGKIERKIVTLGCKISSVDFKNTSLSLTVGTL